MQTITVPFYGNALYVVNHNGEPYTPMKPIVEGMGMDWKSQFRKLNQRFAKGMVMLTIPSDGGPQDMACLALRKLNGWLQTISPNKVKPEIRDKVVQYQEECDDVLYEYWTKGQVVNPRKRSIMQELNTACAELKTDKAIASLFGTGLSEWKNIKAAHTKKVKGLIEEAQLLLTF
ncbi:phage antirepressor N-terminal domain-containing protein [Arsenophonus sp. PmNCSU2021_1]|uniref:phage antirepressor N-terminal domain-containing protein n=1 Tax=Arsenophonus sp. PmNCSU2021_1 TaxID=3118989 RepID=UPI002FEFA8BF